MREALAGQSGSVEQLTRMLGTQQPGTATGPEGSADLVALPVGRVPAAAVNKGGGAGGSGGTSVTALAQLVAGTFLPPGSAAAELLLLDEGHEEDAVSVIAARGFYTQPREQTAEKAGNEEKHIDCVVNADAAVTDAAAMNPAAGALEPALEAGNSSAALNPGLAGGAGRRGGWIKGTCCLRLTPNSLAVADEWSIAYEALGLSSFPPFPHLPLPPPQRLFLLPRRLLVAWSLSASACATSSSATPRRPPPLLLMAPQMHHSTRPRKRRSES